MAKKKDITAEDIQEFIGSLDTENLKLVFIISAEELKERGEMEVEEGDEEQEEIDEEVVLLKREYPAYFTKTFHNKK